MNFLYKIPSEPTKFRTKNWVEINDDSRGINNTNSQTKFKTSMLRSSLSDYSDSYILVNGTITVVALAASSGIKINKQYLKTVLQLLIT